MVEIPDNQLKWVGCLLVLGLAGALGFAGYRTWDQVSHAPAPVSTLPSARVVPLPPAPEEQLRQVEAPPSAEAVPAPAPHAPLQSARLELGALDVSGKLAPEVVRRILRQNFGRLRLCNEKAVSDQRMPAGTVKLRFVIGRDGSVSHATLPNEGAAPREVAACVVQSIEGLNFPRPEQGIVTVSATISVKY